MRSVTASDIFLNFFHLLALTTALRNTKPRPMKSILSRHQLRLLCNILETSKTGSCLERIDGCLINDLDGKDKGIM